MRFHKLIGFGMCLLLAALFGGGCQLKRQANISDQVSQKLADLQQRMRQTPVRDLGTANVTVENKPAWQSFSLSTRELFKPFESTELSEQSTVVNAYKIQLKGVVTIGRPKAIIVIDNKSYLISKGDKFLDITVHEVTENGVEIQRSYKRIQLSVGDSADI